MEYLPLGDLQRQDGVTPIDVEEIIGVLYQSLLALEYLHLQGIAHRDIKPTNILFKSRRPFHVKLADFGMAKSASALRTECGTYLYTAPEIWSGSGYTSAVDIWSLGVVVFQYAYGLPQYGGSSFKPRSWYEKLKREVEDWDPDDLIDLLSSSMLSLEPKQRRTATECLQQTGEFYQRSMDLLGHCEEDAQTPTEVMSPSITMGRTRESAVDAGNSNEPVANRSSVAAQLSNTSRVRTQLWNPPANETSVPGIKEQRQAGESTANPAEIESYQQDNRPKTSVRQAEGRFPKRSREDVGFVLNGSKRVSSRKATNPTEIQAEVLKEDRPGFVQMTVKDKPVTLRKADCWLNATQILALTGKSALSCDQLLQDWRTNAASEVEEISEADSAGFWVSNRVGRIMCDNLQLGETLRPLLHYQHVEDDLKSWWGKDSPDYIMIRFQNASVTVRKVDLRVNATHILKVAGQNVKIEAQRLRRTKIPYDTVCGHFHYQGTYIDIRDALNLCESYGLNALDFKLRQVWGDLSSQIVAEASARPSQISKSVSRGAQPVGSYANASEAPQMEPLACDTNWDDKGEAAAEGHSFYTEPSYSRGSFLLPFDGSNLTQVHPRMSPTVSSRHKGEQSASGGRFQSNDCLNSRTARAPAIQY